jgi:excisionase family DNA binding protein
VTLPAERPVVFLAFQDHNGRVSSVLTPPDLLTTGQAAALLGSSRQHVVDLCDRGLLVFVRPGRHRRIRRADVEALAEKTLTRDQERSLWLHRVVAGRLVLDPSGVMQKARANLERMRQVHRSGKAAEWLSQWQSTLEAGADSVLDALTSRAPRAVELRQNTPFAGVLPEDERQTVLQNFREHWRREHAA